MNRIKIVFGYETDLSGNRIRPEGYMPALNDIMRAATDRFHGATLVTGSGMILKGEHYVKEACAVLECYTDSDTKVATEQAEELAQGIAQGLRQSQVFCSVDKVAGAFVKNALVQTRR